MKRIILTSNDGVGGADDHLDQGSPVRGKAHAAQVLQKFKGTSQAVSEALQAVFPPGRVNTRPDPESALPDAVRWLPWAFARGERICDGFSGQNLRMGSSKGRGMGKKNIAGCYGWYTGML